MFLKMFIKWFWLLWLTAAALAEGELPGNLWEPSVLRLLNKHHSSAHQARTQWVYPTHEDSSHRQTSEGISHGYATHQHGPALRTTEAHSEYPSYSAPSVSEYWRPGSVNLTITSGKAYSYSRPYSASTNSGGGPFHKDALRGSHSMFQYHQVRPVTVGHQPSLKKILPNFLIGKLHNSDSSSKTKYKKTVLYQSPSVLASYKKPSLHPRVHKPYVKHKYPTHKTVHPLYRRYYQSPYQRYAIPFPDMLHNRLAPQTNHTRHKTSTDSYHTTERMDDAYPDGAASSDDYSSYNDTHRNASINYYDSYEEPNKTLSDSDPDPYPASYDETTTRGYYGDRIYMSTHLPLHPSPDKPTNGNTYFILRRTSDDNDIQTIFE